MRMDNDILEIIKSVLANPKRVQGDEGEVEMHSLSDLLKAAEYLRKQEQAENSALGAVFKKIRPDGSID